MERKISVEDLRKAVTDAYEAVKSEKEGEVSPRNLDADPKAFGISVVLTDGTVFNKAEADTQVPMGAIAQVPLHSLLFSELGVDEVVKKSGKCPCHKLPEKPKGLAIGAHGVRAFSAVEPTGDPESKWNLYENRMIDMMGSAPQLAVKTYEAYAKEVADAGTVDALAKAGYYLYDDAELAVKLYVKAQSMGASAQQLATMGATIAADGVNPVTGKVVFDGELSQHIIGLMAAKGPHKMNTPWLVTAGLPAKSSFGGAMVAILPGVGAIAATSPQLNEAGVSVKAAKAIARIAKQLDLSAFSSARVKFVKE